MKYPEEEKIFAVYSKTGNLPRGVAFDKNRKARYKGWAQRNGITIPPKEPKYPGEDEVFSAFVKTRKLPPGEVWDDNRRSRFWWWAQKNNIALPQRASLPLTPAEEKKFSDYVQTGKLPPGEKWDVKSRSRFKTWRKQNNIPSPPRGKHFGSAECCKVCGKRRTVALGLCAHHYGIHYKKQREQRLKQNDQQDAA